MRSKIFKGLTKSLNVSVAGRKVSFPTRDDYISCLVRAGHASDAESVLNSPNHVEAIYRDWQARGQLGCRFAQIFAKHPSEIGIRTSVISGKRITPSSSELTKISIDTKRAVDATGVQALTVIFPEIATPDSLVELCHSLHGLVGWTVVARTNPSDVQQGCTLASRYR